MKAYRGSGGTDPLILNLNTRWRKSGQLHAPIALSVGERPGPLNRRLMGPRAGPEEV